MHNGHNLFKQQTAHNLFSTDKNGNSILPRQPSQRTQEAKTTVPARATWPLQPHPQNSAAGEEESRMAPPRGKWLCEAEVSELHAGRCRGN